MKTTITLLTAVAAANALVLPELPALPSLKVESQKNDLPQYVYSAAEYASETWTEAFSFLAEEVSDPDFALLSAPPAELTIAGSKHRKEFPDLTIYEGIKSCPALTKFTTAVDHYDDVKKVLDSGGKGGDSAEREHRNHTLFVPTDEAFEHLPGDAGDKEPDWDDDRVKRAIEYHVVEGGYKTFDVLKANTLGTILHEKRLGGRPQRLRTGVGLGGVKVNFYSKVIATDFLFKNGVVHALNRVLVPPPTAGHLITLFPSYFSTLLLAAERANFTDEFCDELRNLRGGRTIFAPDNYAWQKLGVKANAFLFNTDKGAKYLNAILRYHGVPNVDFYTDEVYEGGGGDGDDEQDEKNVELKRRAHSEAAGASGREHFELKTLLRDTRLSVDVGELYGLKFVRVNGFVNVKIRDGVAKDGVVHVVDKVLIPPHKHGKAGMEAERNGAEMSVEELVERLEPYLEE